MRTGPGCSTRAAPAAWTTGLAAGLGLFAGACAGPAAEPDSAPTTSAAPDTGQPARTPAELFAEPQGCYERGELERAAAQGDDARAVRTLGEALALLEDAELDRNWARGMVAPRRRIRELEQAP